MNPIIAHTPKPPYYAVIFTSLRTEGDNGYEVMAERMLELARQQPGFLGVESARETLGITVSYWKDLDSIRSWHMQAEHRIAQMKGRESWYKSFTTRIALVERDYNFDGTTTANL
jgi:heme-degrading monooxygenase HmoA